MAVEDVPDVTFDPLFDIGPARASVSRTAGIDGAGFMAGAAN